MLSELKILKLSEKVKEYIKKVEEETGRPVLLKSVQDVGLEGLDSVSKPDPIYTC
jgi:adenylosuccinate synthase